MASTASLSVVVGSAAAAVTFAVVSIIGAASPRPDLGGPVVVEPPAASPGPAPSENDGAGTGQDEG